jgi:predicted nucleotidyltransferase component of viral defense system
MIRQAEISKTAYRLGLSEKTIEKDYVLTWVLHAIASSALQKCLAFKGGTAIKKMYLPEYRFSEDLDFTLLDPDQPDTEILQFIEDLFPWLMQKVNLRLAIESQDEHQTGNFTLYLNYSGPLKSQMEKRSLKIDFSKDEKLVFPIESKPILSRYSDCQGMQGFINVYSMKEILIEKLRSLLSRSEPRDLFDVHYILTHKLTNIEEVSFYCEPKFKAKNLEVKDLRTVLERKVKTFERYWHPRLDGQMTNIPEVDTVVRETQRVLSKYF